MESVQSVVTSKVSFHEIDESSDGQRLDNFLLKLLKGIPKSKVYRIIRKGEVRINKGRCKPETRLHIGDLVRIPPVKLDNEVGEARTRKPSHQLIQLVSQSVIYEDSRILVINKPEGIAVHGGSGLSFGIIEVLREARSELKYLELVHRLDRDTSGVLMLAKKRQALVELHSMFQSGGVKKIYHAWVVGRWPKAKSAIRAPLKKNALNSGERIVVVDVEGKPAESGFKPLWTSSKHSLVEVSPVTGRTHQIRVHSQFAGHPIIGDEKYCSSQVNAEYRKLGIKRMCLHAFALDLKWSDGKTQRLEAPWPLDHDQTLRSES